jgi:DNA-binding NtrC family response regulator
MMTGLPSILVVDDDPLIRLGTVMMLREFGYDPLSANDADSALALMADRGVASVLITDYEMPGRTGADLAHEVLAVQSDTHILIVTGHNDLDNVEAEWSVLMKPFTSEELESTLDAMGVRRS